jgi:cupin superfamily acireductone dioxygenase involved in methionine salvage
MENAIAYNKQIDSILSDPKLPEKYKKFLRKHRNTEQVKQAIISGKLIFHEKGVELDGLKFPINILKYDDVKNIP